MLRNYLKTAVRGLRKHPLYALINIFGLALGLTVCLLIVLFVHDRLSYDDFHAKADRTYRVLREFDTSNLHTTITKTPPALAPAMESRVPDVETAVRVARTSSDLQYGVQTNVVPRVVFVPPTSGAPQKDPQKHMESGFVWAEAGFFQVFSLPILRGEAALARPGTVVLTEKMATKYFPDENPIGQTLRVGSRSLEVTGVMANVPENSHLRYIDFVGSLETLNVPSSWGYNNFTTYVVLASDASKGEVTARVDEIVRAGNSASQDSEENNFIPHLQPITGIHLGQGVSVNVESSGNILYVYLFGALAVFILLLSCINFVNLSTARSMERANEVGMRKALGAGRKQLIGQFLGESVLMSLGALALALLLGHTVLPLLNQLAGTSLTLGTMLGPGPVLVGGTVGMGVLAGSYPALFLSRFEPTHVLKSPVQGTRGNRLRQGLVVFQFVISIAVLVSTAVVFQQLRYMQQASLNFNEENLIVVDNLEHLENQRETFLQEVEQLPEVQTVSSGYSMPSTSFFTRMWASAEPEAERQNVNYSFVGWDYLEALDVELIAGRDFERKAATDSMAVVINEAAAEVFGWSPKDAVGKRITIGGPEYTVVGVTRNFHYESLHAEIHPLVLLPPLRQQNRAAVRVEPKNVAGALEAVRSTWERFSDLSFSYSFLANDWTAQYRTEERLANVLGLFAALAVLIACLGLFGLAAYTAQRRTKEIGIRKAVGATASSIVGLLSKEFAQLVLVAFLVATPVAYLVMQRWLDNFAYRVDLGPGVFLIAGALVLIIALLTVSHQAIRAATIDPVNALRNE